MNTKQNKTNEPLSLPFYGQTKVRLDKNNRLTVPLNVRKGLKDVGLSDDFNVLSGSLAIVQNQKIIVLPQSRLQDFPQEQVEMIYAQGYKFTPDKFNRIHLTKDILEATGFSSNTSEFYFIGRGKYFEIMSKEHWEKIEKEESQKVSELLTQKPS